MLSKSSGAISVRDSPKAVEIPRISDQAAPVPKELKITVRSEVKSTAPNGELRDGGPSKWQCAIPSNGISLWNHPGGTLTTNTRTIRADIGLKMPVR